MITVQHAMLSDRGLRHERNEDRCHADPASGLFFISDGMANEPTPQFVLDHFPELVRHALPCGETLGEIAGYTLQKTVWELNEQVRSVEKQLHTQCQIVGATLVIALVRGDSALVAHVGDSRAYLLRAGKMEQVTHDHSVVQDMLDAGTITAAQAAALGHNGGPTRFIGMPGTILADFRILKLQPADRLLLCSDGLTEMLKDAEIQSILQQERDVDQACRGLVDAANAAGGNDNITVLLLEFRH
jgi:protein phosphatase